MLPGGVKISQLTRDVPREAAIQQTIKSPHILLLQEQRMRLVPRRYALGNVGLRPSSTHISTSVRVLLDT